MVNTHPVLVILLIHALFGLLYAALILFRKSHLRKEYLVPVCILPLIGPLLAITVEWLNISGRQGKRKAELIPPEVEEDILWKTLKNKREDADIVPLEEAILIDDLKTRRKIMLQTLYDDPHKYLDVLMVAKHNDDIETTHYATTTISHSQRQFQLAVQKYARSVDESPDDIDLLDKYIATLDEYIGSGLLEEYLLHYQRLHYAKVLDRKLSKVGPDRDTLVKKLRNSLKLKDYVSAYQVSEYLEDYWPEDEQTWIEALRTCVEARDQKKLEETLARVKHNKVEWTKQGKEQVDFWLKGALP